jgi:hypothetical protein
LAVLGGLAGAYALGALLVVGCGGDDDAIETKDASPDVTTDATLDAVADTTVDSTLSDGGDAGADSASDDAGDSSAVVDASDASDTVDAADGAAFDAGVDAHFDPVAINNFYQQAVSAICAKLEPCCVTANPGATFVLADCKASFTFGFVGELNGITWAIAADGGIVLNEASATACLSAIDSLGCPTATSAQYKTLIDTCYGAVRGMQKEGDPCQYPIQCQDGLYCDRGNGGTSTCKPLLKTNDDCTGLVNSYDDPNYPLYVSSNCSYRARNQTCDRSIIGAADAGIARCVALKSEGADCVVDTECTTDQCSDVGGGVYRCTTTQDLTAVWCPYFMTGP